MSDRRISAAEVSDHCSDNDAWIVLNGVVWDVSGFASVHPGGEDVIIQHYGRDGSETYNDLHSPGLVDKFLGREKQVGILDGGGIKPSNSAAENRFAESVPDLDSIINIEDFEPVAEKRFKPKSFAYIFGSTEKGVTKQANADWYQRILFRPQLLTGVASVDISTTILGQKYASPIFNAPTSSAMLAHPEGELALARGLSACGNTIIIPTMSSYPVGEIVDQLPKNHPFFFQLYVHSKRSELDKLLDMVCELRPQAILVTADLPVMTKRQSYVKFLADERQKEAQRTLSKPAITQSVYSAVDPDLKWKDIERIRERTGLPVFIKGIQCAADARRALESGCSGIYISNHGGRALDTVQPAILTLLEIHACCPEVLDRLEVFIDGGIQRGTDILKAVCLGASAVCLGRPFLYSLAYGEEGVKHAVTSKSEKIIKRIHWLICSSP